MKKQPGQRNFNMPDPDLYVMCLERIRLAHRDLVHFEKYGYSLDRLKGFANQCEQYKNLPDDHEMVGDQMISTEKKGASADRLRAAIRGVMTRVALKFHDKTGRFRKFGTSKLGDMTDPHLLFCARPKSPVPKWSQCVRNLIRSDGRIFYAAAVVVSDGVDFGYGQRCLQKLRSGPFRLISLSACLDCSLA